MDKAKNAYTSTIALLFDGPAEHIQARWNDAVVIFNNENIAFPSGFRFNMNEEAHTEFKPILCKIGLGDVQANLTFELQTPTLRWLKPIAERDQIFRNLLRIIELMAPSHIWWLPAGIVTTSMYFTENLAAYLSCEEAFPVLAFINFKQDDSGTINSRGLKWFCGQELECHLGHLPAKESMRRIARLAHHMMTQGPILLDRYIDGLEDGEQYRLSVDPDEPKVIMTQMSSVASAILH